MAITLSNNYPNSYNYPLTEAANKWVLDKILNVDRVVVQTWLDMSLNGYKVMYSCYRKSKLTCSMIFEDSTPIEDRVTALQVALRMTDGNDTKEQEGSTTTP